jgi:hypothetical protein
MDCSSTRDSRAGAGLQASPALSLKLKVIPPKGNDGHVPLDLPREISRSSTFHAVEFSKTGPRVESEKKPPTRARGLQIADIASYPFASEGAPVVSSCRDFPTRLTEAVEE